jgi:aldose 1-epimerase
VRVDEYALCAGKLRLGVVPELGGAVSFLSFLRRGRSIDVLRRSEPEALRTAGSSQAAMFPMIPFANRLRDNNLAVGTQVVQVRPNVPGQALCLHGDSWLGAWKVLDHGPEHLVIEFRSHDERWPYRYTAEQAFVLSDTRLDVRLRVTNDGESLPFGLGAHPYFPRDPDTMVRFAAQSVWLEGTDFLPTVTVSPSQVAAFDSAVVLPDQRLNHCYDGWAGEALIVHPQRGLSVRMTADPLFGSLMVFTPCDRPYFALEPQSHTSGAFSSAGTELSKHMLSPGASREGSVHFEIMADG